MGASAMPSSRTVKFNPAQYLTASSLAHKRLHVLANHALYSQGDRADSVFYLEAGRAKLIVVSERGKEATVSLMVEHDFIGEESLAGPQGLHTATALAMTACTVLKLSREDMVRLLHQEHAFSDMFLTADHSNLARVTRRCMDDERGYTRRKED